MLPDASTLSIRNLLGGSNGSNGSSGSSSGTMVAAINGGGGGGVARPASEAFQQLRQALTSLDFADNAEQTMDFEDGGFEGGELDIQLDQNASAAVGLTVYETLRIDQQGTWGRGGRCRPRNLPSGRRWHGG